MSDRTNSDCQTEPLLISIRPMNRFDLPAVINIENSSFDEPWTAEDFDRAFQFSNCMRLVSVVDGEIVGFVIYDLQKHFLRLVAIAVRQDMHLRGVGTAMIARLQSKLQEGRREKIILHVRETNLRGQVFFRESGFRCTAIDEGCFDESEEPAYRMEHRMCSIEDQMIGLAEHSSRSWGAGA